MLPRIRDYGDRFPVVLRQCASHLGPSIGAEFHAFSDSKIQHFAVRPHLSKKSEASHNFVIQLNQFFFSEGINIEFIHCDFFPRQRAYFGTPDRPFTTLRFTHRPHGPRLTNVRIPDTVYV